MAFILAGCSPGAQFAHLTASLQPEAPVPADRKTTTELMADAGAAETQVLSYAAAGEPVDPARANLNRLIAKYAALYSVPASLVHSVVRRESTYNPAARNGNHWGLMQINYRTAQTMGYRGTASGLFDAETNLKYGVKYLAGAYLVADGDANRANKLYQTGYYYQAKHKGLLKETGLRP